MAGVFGLSESWLTQNGDLVPDALVLSHHEQLARLRRYYPPAAGVAVIAGDPCLDRLAASGHLRETYRAALGIEPGRRLVVVSSTWGRRSLFGRSPDLLERIAAELPLDEYAVAVALHPNIWHWHSPAQIKGWLSDCALAGVRLVPPLEAWRAAVIAADVVVGDHGSVTFYAAVVGRPVLIAAADPEGVDPESPIARFSAAAPRLQRGIPLRAQLDAVIRDPQRERYAEILTEATSAPGRSAELVRGLLYRMLDLSEPARPARTSIVPVPRDLAPLPVTAMVTSTSVRVSGNGATVNVDRYPAVLRLADPPAGDNHLLVEWHHPDPSLLDDADVLLADVRTASQQPREWTQQALARFPGCALAAAAEPDGSCLIGTRDGRAFTVRAEETTESSPAVLVSAVLALLTAERSLDGGLPDRITIVSGPVTRVASLTELPADPAPLPTPPAEY